MMTVVNNILAINAERQLKIVGKNKSKTTEKLASGYRINRASDDAAGLAISEKMRRQIRGLSRGVNNCQEGISLCQVADGAMAEVHDMIQRMNELCVQAANGTNTDSDREAINQEIQQIKKEIDRIGNNTTFNDIHILQGGETNIKYEEHTVIVKEIVTESYEKEITVSRGVMTDFAKSDDNPWIKHYFGVNCNQLYDFGEGKLELKDVGETDAISYTLDFSMIKTQEDWLNLDSSAMYYTCTAGCGQRFIFLFDSTISTIENLSPTHDMMAGGTQNWMLFSVGTKDFTTGSDFVDAMRKFVATLDTTGFVDTTNNKGENVQVGHINKIGTSTGSDLVVYDTFSNAVAGTFKVYSPQFTNTIKETRTYYKDVEKEVEKKILVPIKTKKDLLIQYGTEAGDNLSIDLPHIDCEALEMTDVAGNPAEKAIESIKTLREVLQKVSAERSRMGSYTNGLEHLVAAENNTIENTTAAESVIRDYDMAKRMVEYSNHNILEQVATAMLAQANHINENISKLLQ